MKKNISISLPKIGNEVTVIFGKSEKNANCLYIEDGIDSEMTQEFLKEYALTSEHKQEAQISGKIKITKEHMLYRLQGEIDFEPMLECVRSLTNFRQKLTASVNCFFVPQNSQKSISKVRSHSQETADEMDLSLEDLETYYFSSNQLLLDEIILDSLYCAIPELPLCRENCKGLCSECGEELNETDLLGNMRLISHRKNCSYFVK